MGSGRVENKLNYWKLAELGVCPVPPNPWKNVPPGVPFILPKFPPIRRIGDPPISPNCPKYSM